MRQLDVVCDPCNLEWYVFGDLLRAAVCGEIFNNESYIRVGFSTQDPPQTNNSLKENVLRMLKTFKLISNIKQTNVTNETITCSVEYLEGHNIITFKVIFYTRYLNDQYTRSDTIILSRNGLSLSQRHWQLDSRNTKYGISLFDALVDLKEKKDTLLREPCNLSYSQAARKENANILRRQRTCLEKGYSLEGRSVSITNYEAIECPICYMQKEVSTKLLCKHKFCIECIATHMEMRGDNYGRCPLCREDLLLDIN